jgi:hypothetical protein
VRPVSARSNDDPFALQSYETEAFAAPSAADFALAVSARIRQAFEQYSLSERPRRPPSASVPLLQEVANP